MAKSSGRRGRVRATVKKGYRIRVVNRLKLLVVVDATEASKRVLGYVGQLAATCDGPEFHLACIGAELLASEGSEFPVREERLGPNPRRQQRGRVAIAEGKAGRILREARATLQQAGVSAARIHVSVSSPLDAGKAADEVLLLARDQQCGTVIIGHRAHSWFRGLGGSDLAEQLVRRAKGYAIWVID